MKESPTSNILRKVTEEGRRALLETEAKRVCLEYHIPTTGFGLAKSGPDAVSIAESIGYPVVLKIVSPDIIHKSDVGGVIVGPRNMSDVRQGYNKIMENVRKHCPDARIEGVSVQEMASAGIEVIVGSIKDPQFGSTIMFGLGGIFVEILKDVSFRIAPLAEVDAEEMIRELEAYPLLKGYRNTPPADLRAVAGILMNTSRLVMENPEIKELDFNPIVVYEKGAKTVDARIILE